MRRSAEADPDVAGLVVDGAGKQEHAGVGDELLAECGRVVDAVKRGKPIGLAVGRTHESTSACRSKNASRSGRFASTMARLRSASASRCRSASALSSSLGALEQIVV